MTIRNEEIIRDKLQFYMDRDESVHLVLKSSNGQSRQFRNGITIEINETNIEFEDEKLGVVIIYLEELLSVDKREEKRW